MIRRLALGALGFALLAMAGLVVWTQVDRTAALSAICKAGLPNFSRPSEVDSDELGCAILAFKSTYSGSYTTGFEVSNFSSADFPKVAGQMSEDDERAWFICPQNGCGAALERQRKRDYSISCISSKDLGIGFASLKVEGWVTVSEGQFGHDGVYPREFYASRILAVGPPPERVIEKWIERVRRARLCDYQVESRL